MDDKELEAFNIELLGAATEKCQELGVAKQEGFSQLVLEDLVEIGTVSDFELCYLRKRLGRGIARVNGYAISDSDARVDLFTTIFRNDEQVATLTQKEMEDAYKQAARVFVFAQGEGFKEMDPASEEYVMFDRLHDAVSETTSLRIILLTNAKSPTKKKSPKIVGLEVEATTECYDIVRYHRWRASESPYEQISIDLDDYSSGKIPCLKMPGNGADYDAYMAIVPGKLLRELYEEYGARLMELNVRSFLQNLGKVNRGIRETILKEPFRFLAYNNGISATAEKIETSMGPDGLVIEKLHGLQIVNGGQTVASIHRAGKVDKADLTNVYAQAKITVVGAHLVDELVPRISRYANTQNKVNEADFSANNPFHVEMEVLSRKVWAPGEASRWFYERARGQYEVLRAREAPTPTKRKAFDARNPKSQRFSKTDLARFVAAWDQKPYEVSLGAQKNFVRFMAEIDRRPTDWKPDADYYRLAVAKAMVYKHAESVGRKHKFPAYRANAVCFTVAYLSFRTNAQLDLQRVWDRQELLPATKECLDVWMPAVLEEIVRTSEGRNVTEWAKKESCWHAIQRLELELPDGLVAELADKSPGQVVSSSAPAGSDAIKLVMEIRPTVWLDVIRWGDSIGNVSADDSRVILELAAKANSGWKTLPSDYESVVGARIYQAAFSEGAVTIEQP